jgi:hypothetical protein
MLTLYCHLMIIIIIIISFAIFILFICMQDLPRTFPGHPWLDTPEGHAALRRVLVGYSFRDSDVGYCQVGLLPCRSVQKYLCAILEFVNYNDMMHQAPVTEVFW